MRGGLRGCGWCDLPNNAAVHIRIVVGDDVAHPSHLSERKCGNLAPGFLTQVGCGFSDTA
jgi:hypothetical protein